MPGGRVPRLEGLSGNEWFASGGVCEFSCAPEGVVASVERRRAQRSRAHLEVRIHPGGRPGSIQDISQGGVFLVTEQLAPVGTLVELEIATEWGNVHARGVVRWMRTAFQHDIYQNRISMGLEFVWVDTGLRGLMTLPVFGLRAP